MKNMKEICWLLAIVLLGFIGYYLYKCKVEHTSQIATVKIQGKDKSDTCLSQCTKNCALDEDVEAEDHGITNCVQNTCPYFCKNNTNFDPSKFDQFVDPNQTT